jgi:hypothetical protein
MFSLDPTRLEQVSMKRGKVFVEEVASKKTANFFIEGRGEMQIWII